MPNRYVYEWLTSTAEPLREGYLSVANFLPRYGVVGPAANYLRPEKLSFGNY
jgi:hypothetical protein